jgi:hypothetical protein
LGSSAQTGHRLTMNTQVGAREINVSSLSDAELEKCERLLTELRRCCRQENPKALPGVGPVPFVS